MVYLLEKDIRLIQSAHSKNVSSKTLAVFFGLSLNIINQILRNDLTVPFQGLEIHENEIKNNPYPDASIRILNDKAKKYFPLLAPENQSLKRARRTGNILISRFIRLKLGELEKEVSWLAKKLNVDRRIVYKYISGYNLPIKSLQKDLFTALKSDFTSVEELVSKYEPHLTNRIL